MQTNLQTQSGAPASVGYEMIMPSPTGIPSTSPKTGRFGDYLASGFFLGAALASTLSPSSAASADWYARATASIDPIAYSDLFLIRGRSRFLSRAEQAVFHRALRRSAKVVYKAKRVTTQS